MSFQWIIKEPGQKTRRFDSTRVDFQDIDSSVKLQKHFHRGDLVKILLMPEEFGGQDTALNTLFVTELARKEKVSFDKKVLQIAGNGKKLFYNVSPEYKGKSMIASKLHLSIIGDASLDHTIHVW